MANKETTEREILIEIAKDCDSTAAVGSKPHNDFCRFKRKKDEINSKFNIALYKGGAGRKNTRRIAFLFPAITQPKFTEGRPIWGAWLQKELGEFAKSQESYGFSFHERSDPIPNNQETEGYVADFSIDINWEDWNHLPKTEKEKILKFYDLLIDWQKANWPHGSADLDRKLEKWNSEHPNEYQSYLEKRNIILQNEKTSTSNYSDKEGGQEETPFSTDNHQLPRNLIYFGAPGTGKSHKLKVAVEGNPDKKGETRQIINDDIGECEGLFVTLKDNKVDERHYERVTFYPTYSYAQFVGCYKPVMKTKSDESSGEEIAYKFVPGPFLRILVKALNNPKNNYCLVIEEINRANAAAVFGDVFQLLDRSSDGVSEYDIAASEDVEKFLYEDEKGLNSEGQKELEKLAKEKGRLIIPQNMYIWATMNSADQGVFPLDTAFKRRWEFEYVGIDEGADKSSDGKHAPKEWTIDGTKDAKGDAYKWNQVRMFINGLLSLHGVNEDKLMGPWFVKPEDGITVSDKQFKSKVLMYLWEDAGRMCRKEMFGDNIKTYWQLLDEWNGKKPSDSSQPAALGIKIFHNDSKLGDLGKSAVRFKELYNECVNRQQSTP